MNHYTELNLIGVHMAIYNPGDTVYENHLEDMEGDLWYLPRECKSLWDCVVLDRTERYYVVEFNQPSRLEHRNIYRFTKWAVQFEFNCIAENLTTHWHYIQPALKQEIGDVGVKYTFGAWLGELVELADPLVLALDRKPCQWDDPHYSLMFVTLWQFTAYTTGGYFEPEEWDAYWELLGRVDVSRLEDTLYEVPITTGKRGGE